MPLREARLAEQSLVHVSAAVRAAVGFATAAVASVAIASVAIASASISVATAAVAAAAAAGFSVAHVISFAISASFFGLRLYLDERTGVVLHYCEPRRARLRYR